MNTKLLHTLLALLFCITANAQVEKEPLSKNYLSVQTGIAASNFKVAAFQYGFEFQRNFKGNWVYGISYDRMESIGEVWLWTDEGEQLQTKTGVLSFNMYYKLTPRNSKKISLRPGLGIGLAHVHWYDSDKIRPTLNASVTIDARISDRFFLQFSPAFMIGNRAYFSPFKYDTFNYFFSCSLFPIGLKIRL